MYESKEAMLEAFDQHLIMRGEIPKAKLTANERQLFEHLLKESAQ